MAAWGQLRDTPFPLCCLLCIWLGKPYLLRRTAKPLSQPGNHRRPLVERSPPDSATCSTPDLRHSRPFLVTSAIPARHSPKNIRDWLLMHSSVKTEGIHKWQSADSMSVRIKNDEPVFPTERGPAPWRAIDQECGETNGAGDSQSTVARSIANHS